MIEDLCLCVNIGDANFLEQPEIEVKIKTDMLKKKMIYIYIGETSSKRSLTRTLQKIEFWSEV